MFTEIAKKYTGLEFLLIVKAGDCNLQVVVEARRDEYAGIDAQTKGPSGLQAVCGAQGRLQVFLIHGHHSLGWLVRGRTAPPLPLWARTNAAAPAWQDKWEWQHRQLHRMP